MKQYLNRFYFKYFWWVWQLILLIISGFFLLLGIEIVIHAYRLKNPYHFILSFFSSNLIIMISLVIMAGIIYRMIGVYRLIHHKKNGLNNDSVRSSNLRNEETKK
jgi:hypothetical protein